MAISVPVEEHSRAKVRVTVSSAGEVTIAGNSEGLRWFAHHILVLARNPDEGHVLKWLMVLGALSLIYMLLVIGWN